MVITLKPGIQQIKFNRIFMTQKKVLMLGSSYFQIPAIKYAKNAGYYVITCDYLPDNPGHAYADEYHNISTTDLNGVLELADRLKVDGIVAYASDPAAPTAAYVSEKLNLPGNPYKSVKILTEKDLFREFLKRHNFNVPFAKGYTFFENLLEDIENFTFPVMVKPVDSSGSKGVTKVKYISHLKDAFNYALSFSRNKRVIIEKYIEMKGAQMHGDAFIVSGKVIFCHLGDHHFHSGINPFVPYSTTIPSSHNTRILKKVKNEVNKVAKILKLRQGAFNIEARINEKEDVYLMEMGPRNGGNLVPQLEEYATGFNMVAASVDASLGKYNLRFENNHSGHYAYYVLHSRSYGKLKNIEFSRSLKPNIIEKHIFKKVGDEVIPFSGSNATIGIILLKFNNNNEMLEKINNMDKYVKITLS